MVNTARAVARLLTGACYGMLFDSAAIRPTLVPLGERRSL